MRKQETNKKTARNHACNPHIVIGIIILTLSFFLFFTRSILSIPGIIQARRKGHIVGNSCPRSEAPLQKGYAPITVTLTVLNPGSVSWTDPLPQLPAELPVTVAWVATSTSSSQALKA
jgi:hypothetical protein